jgi:UDP-galactopyranose mutase
MTKKQRVLVVGAGFSGTVIARELAESGQYEIDVIDKRNHIGGNAYDEIHSVSGARYHKYGPHIFHTNDRRIFEYLSRFTDWLPYQHKVQVLVDGAGTVPMPINLDTINSIYDLDMSTAAEAQCFLDSIKLDIPLPKNAQEYLQSVYGERLTELFFSRYTKKMWGLELAGMSAAVVARIPINLGKDSRYFKDEYQCMPLNGYTALFENMLCHENIKVELGVEFSKSMERAYSHVFNAMPIDSYFDYCFGELPYRSIKFEHRMGEVFNHDVPTVNFSDSGIYTRKTNWDLYPACGNGSSAMITYEIPCDYKDNNMERYYPVKTTDGQPQEIYRQYQELAKKAQSVTFIGRCGQYIYYDMHQVVANSLSIVNDFWSGKRKGCP